MKANVSTSDILKGSLWRGRAPRIVPPGTCRSKSEDDANSGQKQTISSCCTLEEINP